MTLPHAGRLSAFHFERARGNTSASSGSTTERGARVTPAQEVITPQEAEDRCRAWAVRVMMRERIRNEPWNTSSGVQLVFTGRKMELKSHGRHVKDVDVLALAQIRFGDAEMRIAKYSTEEASVAAVGLPVQVPAEMAELLANMVNQVGRRVH